MPTIVHPRVEINFYVKLHPRMYLSGALLHLLISTTQDKLPVLLARTSPQVSRHGPSRRSRAFLKARFERLESEIIDARVTANRETSKVRALISAVNRIAETAKYSAEDAMNLAMEVEIKMKIKNAEIAPIFSDSAENSSGSSSFRTHISEEMDRWYAKMDAEEAAEREAKKKEEGVNVID